LEVKQAGLNKKERKKDVQVEILNARLDTMDYRSNK